jgi:hypothetical protein
MSELGSVYKNITETQLIKLGSGQVKGFIVNSHSSGTLKLVDGVDNTAGAKATSTLTTSGIVYAKFPESTLTSDTTNVADGDTVTIGSIVYRFKDTMLAAYDVKRGADAATSLDNLKAAINASGTPGTEYFAGTLIHPDVTATTNTDTTQKVVSKVIGTANNTKATTETSSHLSWADTTLGGGTGTSVTGVATASSTFTINGTSYYFTNQLSETVNGVASAVANEILWVTNDATALDNMKLAINGSGTEGTNYSTGTNANPDVIATTNGNTTQVIEARVFGTLGNSITTTETMTTTAWTGTTLSGGTEASRVLMNTYTPATGSSVITFPDGINFVNGLFATVANTADITVVYN